MAKSSEKEAPLSELAWGRYKENLGNSLLFSLSFLLMGLSSLAFGLISPSLLFLTVPFLGIPALFSFQLSLHDFPKGQIPPKGSGWAAFGAYYSQYFGVYRVWLSFFRAFLVWLLFALVLSIGLYYSELAWYPEFAKDAQAFVELSSNTATTQRELAEFYSSSLPLQKFSALVSLISLGLGGLMFVHEIGRNGLNLYVRHMIGVVPSRYGNAMFGDFFVSIRKKFYPAYYQAFWPLILVYLFGYFGFMALGFGLLGPSSYVIEISYAGALLCLSFFLPYYYYGLEIEAGRLQGDFASFSLRMAEEALKETQARNQEEQEELAQMQKDVDDLKKKLNDKQEGDDSSSGQDNGNEGD